MQLSLKLLPTDRAQRPTSAYLVPGASCVEWLAELTSWGIPLAELRLFGLPVGLFVTVHQLPASVGRARPYGQLSSNVFAPVEAILNAAASSEELQSVFSADSAFVWHPSAGLFILNQSQAIGVADLLAKVPAATAGWDRAQAGIALNRRILSLAPEKPIGPQDLWQEVQGDIGSRRPTLQDLPPSPSESSGNPLSKLRRAAAGQIARLAQWMSQARQAQKSRAAQQQKGAAGAGQGGGMLAGAAGMLGAAASGMLGAAGGLLGQWGTGVSDWAKQKLAQMSQALEEERHREISRLLNLLSSDPDAGLRFAIPFSNEAGRGIATPSSRLVERATDFSLSGGSGGPVDGWNISHEYRFKLIAKYRELANREIALGRYRRAAYVFAHLLGDYVSAARTLVDGGHWREAAVLYEEKLGQPLEAARSLEKGSLWTEAIAIYERLGQDEKVGDLYRQISQPDSASIAYRRAVAKLLRADDRVSAARLMEEKLEAVDEAVQVIVGGWPESSQSVACLQATFPLLGRLGLHDRAEKQVRRFRQLAGRNAVLGAKLAECYAGLATSYPSSQVRQLAADETRLLAAEHLESSLSSNLVHVFAESLRKLAPQDRLLARDTQRFALDASRKVARSAPVRKPAIRLVREIPLPPGDWLHLLSVGEGFYAAGLQGGAVQLARCAWTGEDLQSCLNPRWRASGDSRSVRLAANPHFGLVVVQMSGAACEGEQSLPQTTTFGRVRVGGHPGVGPDCLLAAYDDLGVFHAVNLEPGSELSWSRYATLEPNLLGTRRVAWHELLERDDLFEPRDLLLPYPIPLTVRDDTLYLSFGQWLLRATAGRIQSQALPSTIHGLALPPPYSRQRIAVALEDGGVLLWDDERQDAPDARFGEGLGRPQVCLNRCGLLMAAADGVMEVYDTRSNRLAHLAMKAEPGFRPRAVAATQQPNEFAVLAEESSVLIYQVEGWTI